MIYPQLPSGKPIPAPFGCECKQCHLTIMKGSPVYKTRLWSMTALEFYEGYLHPTCFATHPDNSFRLQASLESLYTILGLPLPAEGQLSLPEAVWVHQFRRPLVLGQRPNGKRKKITDWATTLVSMGKKPSQLLITLGANPTAYCYDPSYKGTVVAYRSHPMLASSWRPLEDSAARFIWYNT